MPDRRSLILPLVVTLLTIVPGCRPGTESDEVSSAAGAGDSVAARNAAGPAEAGLVDLVSDIRSGIEPLAATVEERPDSARQRAIRLYVTRQEVIEARWGPRAAGGEASSPLADAVIDAEERFHVLMERLSADPPPDSVAVAGAVDSLDARLVAVLREAERAGVE